MPLVKSDEQRGRFGAWLRAQRLSRYPNNVRASKAIQRSLGYGVAPSVLGELEAGTRKPSDAQYERLVAFYGSEPPLVTNDGSDPSLAEAIRLLTAAVEKQNQLLDRALTEGLRTQLSLADRAFVAGTSDVLRQQAARERR